MSCFCALTFCFLIAIKFVSPRLTGHLFCECLLTEFLAAVLIVTQLSAIICVAGMFLFSPFSRPGKKNSQTDASGAAHALVLLKFGQDGEERASWNVR